MKKSQPLRGIKIVLQTTLIKAYEILVPDKIYRSELNSDKCPPGLIVFDLPPLFTSRCSLAGLSGKSKEKVISANSAS
jgi:hypothetical protein